MFIFTKGVITAIGLVVLIFFHKLFKMKFLCRSGFEKYELANFIINSLRNQQSDCNDYPSLQVRLVSARSNAGRAMKIGCVVPEIEGDKDRHKFLFSSHTKKVT